MRPKTTAASRARWVPDVDGDLIGWRRRQLSRAGFGVDLAARVAADRSMDIHALLELIDLGCPPELAMRIVAPLDREDQEC
jgi:hypothetical protein